MRIYKATGHDGHYISGSSVVVAPNEDRARELLAAELESRGLDSSKQGFEMEEIDPSHERAHVLFDGDY